MAEKKRKKDREWIRKEFKFGQKLGTKQKYFSVNKEKQIMKKKRANIKRQNEELKYKKKKIFKINELNERQGLKKK